MRLQPEPVADPADDDLSPSLKPLPRAAFGAAQARHLLWRAGFGATEAQIATIAEWGPERSVDHLLGFAEIPYEDDAAAAFDKDIMHPPTEEDRRLYAQARRSQNEDVLAQARAERQRREQADRKQVVDLQRWWLRRMIETPRPLEEKLTLFWHGHFATNYRVIEDSWHVYQQNRLFRRNASGSFATLLAGIIRDPAMIAYLDNNDSRKGMPNENLARELMELFSLGVGNYREGDIKEGARALTGYTFKDDDFEFNRRNHDAGGKTILGRKGNLDGEGFVAAILARRACAAFITRKLYAYFVADIPMDERGREPADPAQKAVLKRLASTLYLGRYEIRPVLRALFLSEHFYEPRVMGEQIKSPVQLVVGAVRSLGTPVRDLSILNDALDLMGQRLFHPPSVKGWDGGRSWINTSTLFVRQNIAAFLLTGKKPQGYDTTEDSPYDPLPLLIPAGTPGSPDALIDAALRVTLGRTPPGARDQLWKFIEARGGAIDRGAAVGALLLATAMPEYQLC